MNIEAACAKYPAPGFRALCEMIVADKNITDVRWAAYMLATVKWECADKWEPIEEIGKGAGRIYGVPRTVVIEGKEYSNTYYGRGYVQLTWFHNYKTLGFMLGRGFDFVKDPNLLLQRDIAYQVMSLGMRKGLFTGVSLAKFITPLTCDFFNARRIINGLDKAEVIAEYAQQFLGLLK